MLTLAHLSRPELVQYVVRQLENFFPDGKTPAAHQCIDAHLETALGRLGRCINEVRLWTPERFDHLHSTQYTLFLYYLSNTLWHCLGDRLLCNKLFGLNKALNGIDLFYEIEMPEVMFIGHSAGIVFAKATYGNYLAVYQNSTVGKNHGVAPVLGQGILMYPNTAIIGRCQVRDGTVLAQGVSLVNTDTPGHCTAFRSPNGAGVWFKNGKTRGLEDIFRSSPLF